MKRIKRWFLAYQYRDENGIGLDEFRCVDNHGSYNAVISRSWMSEYAEIDN